MDALAVHSMQNEYFLVKKHRHSLKNATADLTLTDQSINVVTRPHLPHLALASRTSRFDLSHPISVAKHYNSAPENVLGHTKH